MFPETFAEKWIARLTKPRQVILDPFCGRGTTPFQALLMRRRAIACDINPVAFCITQAKTSHVSRGGVLRRITQLEKQFDPDEWDSLRRQQSEFFRVAFSAGTLRQILFLRHTLQWRSIATDSMIAALVLGSLHGESEVSPSYLSNQMPRTISTKPAYSVRFWRRHGFRAPRRDAFELLRSMTKFRFASKLPGGNAHIVNQDMRALPTLLGHQRRRISCVITSPPYFDVTNFEEDQWLRLWFLGGLPHPTRGLVSRDDRHEDANKYWSFIADMWRSLGQVLAPRSHIVIRLGTGRFDAKRLISPLAASSQFAQRQVELLDTEISPIPRRQTDAFRPGSSGCRHEVDCHFLMR
jgi:hypothetical protein